MYVNNSQKCIVYNFQINFHTSKNLGMAIALPAQSSSPIYHSCPKYLNALCVQKFHFQQSTLNSDLASLLKRPYYILAQPAVFNSLPSFFFYMKKACESVPHTIHIILIIQSLSNLGIPGPFLCLAMVC